MVERGQKLLSANELAELLGVAVRTIYDHARDGTIPFYAVGRARRFNLDEVLSAYRGGQPPSTRRKDDETKNKKRISRYEPYDWGSFKGRSKKS